MTVLRSDRRALEGKDTWVSNWLRGKPLFDDLFYQWFCDLAQSGISRMSLPKNETINRGTSESSVCRKIRKSFSVFYATRKPSDADGYTRGRRLVGRGDRGINLGDFELEGADEFFDRACATIAPPSRSGRG